MVQLINDAIIKVDCSMVDEDMVNAAYVIEEVRDVIPTLMIRLHTTLVKSECEGCRLYHPSQTQHRCLDLMDEETGELIRMVYASNNPTMPHIQVNSVLEIHGQLIKDIVQL